MLNSDLGNLIGRTAYVNNEASAEQLMGTIEAATASKDGNAYVFISFLQNDNLKGRVIKVLSLQNVRIGGI